MNTTNLKYVDLTFYRDELLYDIKNYCYIESHVMEENAEEAKHTVADVGETGNVDRVTRLLNLYFSEVVESLYPYTKTEINKTTDSDVFTEPEKYEVHLSLPESMSITTVRLMRDLIHEFLVCMVVGDWLSITNQKSSETWVEKGMYAKERLRSIVNSRGGVIRRKSHPF